jgi:hypothetical protein
MFFMSGMVGGPGIIGFGIFSSAFWEIRMLAKVIARKQRDD